MGLKSLINKITEDIFNTDIFREYSKKYDTSKINISSEEKERIDSILNIPDAKPYDVDVTLSNWLLRISLWGRITITHKNPEKRINRRISTSEFLDYVDNKNKNGIYGLWHIQHDEIDRVVFWRTFDDIYGKEIKEELIVDIDLRSDLKQILRKARREKGLFSF